MYTKCIRKRMSLSLQNSFLKKSIDDSRHLYRFIRMDRWVINYNDLNHYDYFARKHPSVHYITPNYFVCRRWTETISQDAALDALKNTRTCVSYFTGINFSYTWRPSALNMSLSSLHNTGKINGLGLHLTLPLWIKWWRQKYNCIYSDSTEITIRWFDWSEILSGIDVWDAHQVYEIYLKQNRCFHPPAHNLWNLKL